MADTDFLVRIWGARGSLPAPAGLNSLFGSDTCCVEMRCGPHIFIFDAGSGAAALSASLVAEGQMEFDLLFSHCHFDHIQGLPFMKPLYSPNGKVRIFTGHFEDDTTGCEMVDDFMRAPFFPVTPKYFHADIEFVDFRPPAVLTPKPGVVIHTARLNHPNGAVGFRVEFRGHVVCYVTDTEHIPGILDARIVELIDDADIVIYDTMYSDAEFPTYVGYGHSTWEEGIRLCEAAGARRLVLFHHRLERDDRALQQIEAEAQARFPGAVVARTGMELRPGERVTRERWRRKA